jgi:DNA-binding NtrC family response regulator
MTPARPRRKSRELDRFQPDGAGRRWHRMCGSGRAAYDESLERMTTERPAKRAAKVLIVDDDAHLGAMLSDLIRTLGHEPSWVSDGAAALRALAQTQTDLVLLDILMPGISGVDLLPSLQALAPGVPVIMLSGVADEELGREALARGAFDYVVKPVDVRQLAQIIDLALLTDSDAGG